MTKDVLPGGGHILSRTVRNDYLFLILIMPSIVDSLKIVLYKIHLAVPDQKLFLSGQESLIFSKSCIGRKFIDIELFFPAAFEQQIYRYTE